MANAIATLTVNAYPNGVDNTQRRQELHGTCALSSGGTYVNPGGIPISWASLLSAEGGAFIPDTSNPLPVAGSVFFTSQSGATGYSYIYSYATQALRIWNGGTELLNAAAITPDTIGFIAEFSRF